MCRRLVLGAISISGLRKFPTANQMLLKTPTARAARCEQLLSSFVPILQVLGNAFQITWSPDLDGLVSGMLPS